MRLTPCLLALFALAPCSAFAADTSGCSPMRTEVQSAATAAGPAIQGTLSRAPMTSCWNAADAAVKIEYRFTLAPEQGLPRVHLWVGVNGAAKDEVVVPVCQAVPSRTGASTMTVCVATVSVPVPPAGELSVEVAPSVNDVWDTGGYGHNVTLKF